jgi:hypothetical protein
MLCRHATCAATYIALLRMSLLPKERELATSKLAECGAGMTTELLVALELECDTEAVRRFEHTAAEAIEVLCARRFRSKTLHRSPSCGSSARQGETKQQPHLSRSDSWIESKALPAPAAWDERVGEVVQSGTGEVVQKV